MKAKLHPQYFQKVKVTCACGNTFETSSTNKEINVEICSKCHPFFTGKAKLIDTAGRVDRFRARLDRAKQLQAVKKKSKQEKRETKLAKAEQLAKKTEAARTPLKNDENK